MSDQPLDRDRIKLLLGKILGEIYRIQRKIGIATEGQGVAFGLRRGIESVLEDTFRDIGGISIAQIEAVDSVLEEYFADPEKLSAFTGFYEIEPKLAALGVCRGTAITILKYKKATGPYDSVLDKMKGPGSPQECRTFELGRWDE